MWELDHKEGWALKNWCFWTVVLETMLESPLDCKEIKPVSCKGNQSWIFIGRTVAEAEAPILWPPDVKRQLIGKDPDAGKDWKQEEKGMTEDEMARWYHRLNEHEFEQALGAGDGQGNLSAAVHGVAKSWTRLSTWTRTRQRERKVRSARGSRKASGVGKRESGESSRDQQRPWRPQQEVRFLFLRHWRWKVIGGFLTWSPEDMEVLWAIYCPCLASLSAKLTSAINILVTTFSPHSFNPDHLGSGCHCFSAKVLIKVIRDYISPKFVTMLSPLASQPHSSNWHGCSTAPRFSNPWL